MPDSPRAASWVDVVRQFVLALWRCLLLGNGGTFAAFRYARLAALLLLRLFLVSSRWFPRSLGVAQGVA